MVDDDFWKTVQAKERSPENVQKSGALNIALLFGTAVIALTLILTPMMSGYGSKRVAGAADNFDMISTGSIQQSETGKRYTLRRSVLQETPGSVCLVEGYGAESGC